MRAHLPLRCTHHGHADALSDARCYADSRRRAARTSAFMQFNALQRRPVELPWLTAAYYSPEQVAWRMGRERVLVPFVISMANRCLNRLAAHQRLLLAPTFESRLTLHLPWPATTLVHAFSDTASLIALLVACWGGVVAHPIVLAMSVRWWQAATDLMPLNGRIRRTNPWRWRAGTASGIALTEYERRLGESLSSHCDHVILPQPDDQSQPVMRLHLVSFADLAVSACALAVTCRPRLNFAGVRAPEAEAFVPLKVKLTQHSNASGSAALVLLSLLLLILVHLPDPGTKRHSKTVQSSRFVTAPCAFVCSKCQADFGMCFFKEVCMDVVHAPTYTCSSPIVCNR